MMLVKAKLAAEKRVELVHVSLMRAPEFALFAGLFMVGKTTIEDDLGTAATNGRDAFYGRAFVDSLTDKELAFLIMHENMHKCYRHLTTWRALYELDKSCANQACDYVINIQLRDMDEHGKYIVMPTDKDTGKPIGLIDEKYRGMDTKQVFDILRKEKQEKKCGGEQTDGESGSSDGYGAGLDEHDWDGAQDGMTKEEQEQLGRDIDQALRQGGIYAGKVGGNMPREIGELLKPKVNWREVLRRFVRTSLKDRDSVSWRRAHKNYLWQDIILPSIMGKRVKHLVIAMDTSGSIQGPILTEFLSEMNGIVRDTGADRVDVVYWDTEIAGHEIHKGSNKDIVHRTNPKGGGGTDPDCVVDFMTGQDFKPDALIMLTDGYMHTNKPKWAAIKVPTLWCVIGNEKYEVPNGQKLNIN